jgi:ABC-type uncharacterized transport system permease subunit
MRRILGSLYVSIVCGLLGYFLAEYFKWTSVISGIAVATAAIIGFFLSNLKVWLEIKKAALEVDLKKEELKKVRSRVYLPQKADIDKYGQPFAIVDRDADKLAGTRTYSHTAPPVHR